MAGAIHGRGHVWQGGPCMVGSMHGRGHVLGGMCGRGACVVGGMHDRGCVWQERRPLQRASRILLECILLVYQFTLPFKFGVLFEEISPVESAGTSVDPLGYFSQVFRKISKINFIEPSAGDDGIMNNLSATEI